MNVLWLAGKLLKYHQFKKLLCYCISYSDWLFICVLSLKIRYLWKIFKGPPKCWCRRWRYAKNTWTTPSRASPLLLLDSCVVSIKGHSPRMTKFTTMIVKPLKVVIVDWEKARVSKSLCWKSNPTFHTFVTRIPVRRPFLRVVVYQENTWL